MYFYEETPYKRSSNQIIEVKCFSEAAIGDIYLDLIPLLREKWQLSFCIGVPLPKETSSQVHIKIKSGGGLYQRQQTRLSCYTVLIK